MSDSAIRIASNLLVFRVWLTGDIASQAVGKQDSEAPNCF